MNASEVEKERECNDIVGGSGKDEEIYARRR